MNHHKQFTLHVTCPWCGQVVECELLIKLVNTQQSYREPNWLTSTTVKTPTQHHDCTAPRPSTDGISLA